jgi:hypothetical protein
MSLVLGVLSIVTISKVIISKVIIRKVIKSKVRPELTQVKHLLGTPV